MAREYGIKLGMDSRELDRKAARSRRELNRLGASGAAVGTKVEKGSRQATAGLQSITRWGSRAGAVMAGIGAVVGSATFFTKGAARSREFGKAMGEVSTLLDDITGFDDVKRDVQDLSASFGTANVEQASALYQTISAGAESTAAAMNTLTTANKLAIGGVTDVATSVDGLTTVLNSYGDQVESAADVADTLFTGVKLGKTTIDELSITIGRVTPLAANAQIEFDELTSIIATLTSQGLSTAEAVTGVRGALTAILKPTGQAKELANELGLEFDLAALRAKGFTGFMGDVREAVGDNDAALGQLFGQVEGLNAVLSLTGESGAAKMEKAMEAMANRAGATNTAFEKMKDTPDQALKEFAESWNQLSTAIGDSITESDRFIGTLRTLTDWFDKLRGNIQGQNEELSRTEFLMNRVGTVMDALGFDDLGQALGDQTTMIGRLNMSLVNSLDTLNTWATEGRGFIMDPIAAWQQYDQEVRKAIEAQQRAREAFSGSDIGSVFSAIIEDVSEIGPAVEQAAAKMRAMGQTELADEMLASLEAARGLSGALRETGDAAGDAANEVHILSEGGRKVKASFEEQITALDQEIFALRNGEQAALKYKLQQAALTEENEGARKKLLELIPIILEMTEKRSKLEEQIEKEKEAEQRLQETRDRVSQSLDSMLRKIDPVIKAERELLEVKQLLEEAERSGIEVTQDRKDAIIDYHTEALEAARATQVYEQAIQAQLQTMNQGGSSFNAVQSAVNLANQALDEGVNISREWLSTLEELAGDHDINVNWNTSGKPPDDKDEGAFSDQFIGRAAGTASRVAQQELGMSQGIGSIVGSTIGSIWGPIGTAVGGFLGSAVDTLFGSGAGDEPTFRFASQQPSYSDLDQSRQTPFGSISTGEVYNVDQGQIEDILNQVAEFDRRLTGLFDPSEYDDIAAALQNMDQTFEGSMANAQAIMEERFITALNAVQPELVDFIEGFGDLENMMRAFAGIEAMERQIADVENAILTLSDDTLDQLTASINRMDTSLEESRVAWERAQASQDPEQIAQAADTLKQQIMERYRFERDLIRGIQSDIEALQQATRDFNRSIAETIAELTGSSEELLEIDREGLSRARQGVLSAEDATEGLERVSEFTTAVENWLDTSIQRVEELRDLELERINQAINAAQTQYQALEDEASQIMAAAQQRAQRAQQRAQVASQAAQRQAQEARKRELDALKAQLSVAEEMLEVADRAKGMLEDLDLSGINPASAQSRFTSLQQEIERAQSEFQASGDAESANRLLDLLEDRLGILGENQIAQRGSDRFLELYNDTVAQISEVERQAREEGKDAKDLQQQIADLQGQTKNAVSGGFSASISAQSQLSASERRRLEEIKEEQAALQEEIAALEEEAQAVREDARDQIEALKDEAVEHYRWIQNEREGFADERNEELTDRLDLITGGLGPDSYLAGLQEDSREYLRQITGTMSDLLDEWRNMEAQEEGGGGGIPGPPGGGGPGPYLPSATDVGTKDHELVATGGGGGTVVHLNAKVTGTVDGKGADQFVRTVGPKLARFLDTHK